MGGEVEDGERGQEKARGGNRTEGGSQGSSEARSGWLLN